MSRLVFVAAIAAVAGAAGCRSGTPIEEPKMPQPQALEGVTDRPVPADRGEEDPQADAVRDTVMAFRDACLQRDADACLSLYTDEVRERVEPWFASDAVFEVADKSSQALWCDPRDIVVDAIVVDGERATAHAHLESMSRSQCIVAATLLGSVVMRPSPAERFRVGPRRPSTSTAPDSR